MQRKTRLGLVAVFELKVCSIGGLSFVFVVLIKAVLTGANA
jgi:hypothetical protein